MELKCSFYNASSTLIKYCIALHNQALSQKASSPVIADTGSATTEHILLFTFLNHKVLTFIVSYLADYKHFEALRKNDWIEQLFYFLKVQVWCL